MAGAFIQAKDLRKTYHVGKIEVEALRGISFSVQKGELSASSDLPAAASPRFFICWVG